ncbi:MAG: FtsW/RodA/SpoVE family cell cycle protein [bacterium]|nr:FtsW/RodA/SpoVE family cell cycle protein [bacterium]
MLNIIIDVSKYFMILFAAIYTYYNFSYFRYSEMEEKHRACAGQIRVLFVFHALAYGILYLKTQELRVAVFYVAQVVFFLLYIYLFRLLYKHVSRVLVNNVCFLSCVGLVILTRLNFDRAVRQFVILVLSAFVTWLIPFVIDRVWQLSKIPWVYGIAGVVLLLVVLVLGSITYGAQLSIEIGGIRFQPSEFVKISFVFFVATMFYRSTSFRQVCITTAMAALHVLILIASRDLGGALIFFLTYLCMLFVATDNWGYLVGGLGIGAGGALLAAKLFTHVAVRVSAWLNPWADIDNTGYQITQSLFAIGTGGWFGMGLYQGMPKRIPVVEKDFVFAAISEEMGGLFALCLILICLGCFLQLILVANQMQAMFYKLIAFGLGIEYIVQVFLTVGGVTKFIPSTGVTLPFVSYGGSSVLSTFIMFHVIQGLYILKRNEEEEFG